MEKNRGKTSATHKTCDMSISVGRPPASNCAPRIAVQSGTVKWKPQPFLLLTAPFHELETHTRIGILANVCPIVTYLYFVII